ncbi:MAG: ATP-binding protein, partial [Caulobacteraceae bacterium]
DLEAAVRDTCAAVADVAHGKEVSLEVSVSQEVCGFWRGDVGRIRQVLNNLVSNALKFTPAGKVVVDVARGSDDGVVLTILDTGIGISADHIPKLFAKFHQVDSANTRRFGGTGLGLAICRELVELMGGQISVDSAQGQGATFTVRLPLKRAEVVQGTAGRVETPLAQLTSTLGPFSVATDKAETVQASGGLRVLAAEDNPANQLVLRALLQAFDLTPLIVENGAIAVEAWAHEDFDIIFMDIQMPELDGVDATRRIRALERQSGRRRIPIIALTANVMAHQIEEYFYAGMDDVLAKPIEIARLAQALQAVDRPADEGQVWAA